MLRTFTDPPPVMIRAVIVGASNVAPTGTTCGLPSARSVVKGAQVTLCPEGEDVWIARIEGRHTSTLDAR
jgi:hypothetical protein